VIVAVIIARADRRPTAVLFGARQESAIASKVQYYVPAIMAITKHQITNKFKIQITKTFGLGLTFGIFNLPLHDYALLQERSSARKTYPLPKRWVFTVRS